MFSCAEACKYVRVARNNFAGNVRIIIIIIIILLLLLLLLLLLSLCFTTVKLYENKIYENQAQLQKAGLLHQIQQKMILTMLRMLRSFIINV